MKGLISTRPRWPPAIPDDDDCRTWAKQPRFFNFHGRMQILSPFFDSMGCFFLKCKHCRKLCDVFHQCMAQGLLMHPALVPPRDQQKELHLALHSTQVFISTLVALLEAVQKAHPFTLYLCVYWCSLPRTSGNIGSLVRFQFGDEQTQASMKLFRASPLKRKK